MPKSQNTQALVVAPAVSAPALLASESPTEFEAFSRRVWAVLKPKDVIEEILADDYVRAIWDIQRYRRIKSALIDSVRTVALMNVLALMKGDLVGGGKEEREVAVEWFDNPDGRDRIRALLRSRDLSEVAIDAEAVRLRLQELEKLDVRIASAQNCRDRMLQQFADYRSSVSFQNDVAILEHAPFSESAEHSSE